MDTKLIWGMVVDGDDPLATLDAAIELRKVADAAIEQAVKEARAKGAAWAVLGARIGVSAQAVEQRYGATIPDPSRRGKGYPTQLAKDTAEMDMVCRTCGETKKGKKFPTLHNPTPG